MKRYYITDRKSVGGLPPLLEIIKQQMHFGVDYIQLREKDLPARELYEFAAAVLAVRKAQLASSTKILINTRADIAKALGADGVHLTASAPRETLPGLLVARSCHAIEEVRSAQADLVTFGPIFATPNKGPAVGLSALIEACQAAKPKLVFALGGITEDNARTCVSAGAAGIAAIRLFQALPKLQ